MEAKDLSTINLIPKLLLRDVPKEILERKIIHVDMDCYFAAVEELDNPDLKGKPVAVGGSPTGRGVLATANYEARKYGVRSAMSSAEALRRCPELIFVRPRGTRYKEISQKIREIFARYTTLIEPLSLDEAYLDVTGNESFHGSATLIAKAIQNDIYKETGLTASAGVAPNKFLAKIASDWNKPNGIFTVTPAEAMSFSLKLSLRKVPGIGEVTQKKCDALGLKTLQDIQDRPISWLEANLGKLGPSLLKKSYGLCFRKVASRSRAKSISTEETYNKDLHHFSEIGERIPFLVEELLERAGRHYQKRKGEHAPIKIFIKMKTSEFKNHTHEVMLKTKDFTIESEVLSNNAHLYYDGLIELVTPMYKDVFTRLGECPLRLLGLGFRLSTSSSDELEKLGQLRLL